MENFATRPIASLSTGQWQRVLFARLCLQRARLLLLDEPLRRHRQPHHPRSHPCAGTLAPRRLHRHLRHARFPIGARPFPQTVVLARDLIAWGDTKTAMSDENLARASALAGSWSEHADACAA